MESRVKEVEWSGVVCIMDTWISRKREENEVCSGGNRVVLSGGCPTLLCCDSW